MAISGWYEPPSAREQGGPAMVEVSDTDIDDADAEYEDFGDATCFALRCDLPVVDRCPHDRYFCALHGGWCPDCENEKEGVPPLAAGWREYPAQQDERPESFLSRVVEGLLALMNFG